MLPSGGHSQTAGPEVKGVNLGYIALTDAAPLIVAKERGMFAARGLPDVEVQKQASWGGTRDNLVLGGERGGIDGAHLLTPLAYLIHTGRVVQNATPVPMAILARLNTNGQAISVSNALKGATLDAKPLKAVFAAKTDNKVAMTFRGGTHDVWLRYWLAAGGIDPDKDVQTIVVPPPQMVANMKVGTMDAFCVGEPWNDQLVNQKIGTTACITGEIWRDHPEKSLALRADWVAKYPRAAEALTAAVIEAQLWADQLDNKAELAAILGKRAWFNVPPADILPRSLGNVDYGDGLQGRGLAAPHEILGRPRQLPVSVARFVVPHRGPTLGRVPRRHRHRRADPRREPRRHLARRRQNPGQIRARGHQPRRRNLLRRHQIRPGQPRRLPREPRDQEGRSMSLTLSRAEPRRLPQISLRGLAAVARSTATAAVPLIVVLVCLLGVWQIAASRPGSSLPPPTAVWATSHELITHPFYDRGGLDKGLALHLYASLTRVILGFSLAGVAGVLLGLLVGTSAWATRGLDPVFQVLRTVPPLAWLPLSLAAFRDAQPSAIFVIFITAIWPVIINTAVGVRQVPSDYLNVARVIRLRGPRLFTRIILPSAAPYIFTGLRIGIGLSWLAIVAAEMLIGGVGIGFFIWDAWNSSNISDIIVALVYVGLVGFILDRIVALAGRLVTKGVKV